MPVVLAPEIVALTIFLICLCLLLLRAGYANTIGAMLHLLASLFDAINFTIPTFLGDIKLGLGFIGDGIRSLDNAIMRAFGAAIGTTDYAAKKLWHWCAYIIEQTGRVIGDLAEETYGSLHYLRAVTVPLQIAARLDPLGRLIGYLQAQIAHLVGNPTEIITKTTNVVAPRIGQLEREVGHLEAQVGALAAGAVAVPAPIPFPSTGDITRGLGAIWQKIRGIAGVLTPAGIIGLAGAAIFEQFGLGWLKCRGVNRVGRKLCGLSGLIESLALDAVDALAIANLCWIIEAMTVEAAGISSVVTEYGAELNTLLKCRGIRLPAAPALTVTALPVPWAAVTFGRSHP